MKRILYILFAAATFLTACKPLAPDTRRTGKPAALTSITFATFTAVRLADQTCRIDLSEMSTVAGQMKDNPKTAFLYPMEVILEDSAHKAISTFTVEHPLIENFEFTNDQGQLQRMVRTLDSNRFHLRFNNMPGMKFIRFQSDNPSVPVINSIQNLSK